MIDYTGLGLALILKYKYFLLSMSCLFLGGAGAWFISRTPMRLSLMDWPNDRSSHSVPTPRGGGIGIFLAVILAGLALKLPTNFLFPIIVVSMIGFYGDFFQLSVRFRLIVQLSAAFFVVFSLLPNITSSYLQSHPNLFFLLIVLIPIVTAIYIVGSANFFNFMDGINGIAGISGTICFGLLGMYGFVKGQDASFSQLSLFSIYVALACIGFIPFNIPKAKVFLGDVGSILLGFTFAVIVVAFSRDYFDILCLSTFLFPFYADELTTMIVRLKDRENLIEPHRRHLYQILANEMEIAHWKVSAGYGLCQLLIGIGMIVIRPYGICPVIIYLTCTLLSFVVLTTTVRIRVRRQLSVSVLSDEQTKHGRSL